MKILPLIIFLALLTTASVSAEENSTNVSLLADQVTCTQEAKICPDGTVLERDPAMRCQFPKCPTCSAEGEMCGGIQGKQCCSDLVCDYEGDFPDAAGTCVEQGSSICQDLCGDGTCQDVTCQGTNCPCSENSETCPTDCAPQTNSNSSLFTKSPLALIVGAILFVFIGLRILKWVFWTLAIVAILSALALWWIF